MLLARRGAPCAKLACVHVDGLVRGLRSGVLAEGSFQDPENARTIYLMAGGLALIAVALTVGTIVWWRSIRPEHPALGPLEVMGRRKYRASSYAERKMAIEAARPVGAQPLAADVPQLDPIDLRALVRSRPPKFDDLLDPAVAAYLDGGREEAVDLDALLELESSPPLDETSTEIVGDGEDSALDAVDDADDADDAVEDESPPIDYSPSSGLPIDPLLRMQSAE